MEICRSSQMSFVGLMQLPHWKSNLQAVLLPQGNIHMIPTPFQQRGVHSDHLRAACGSHRTRPRALGWLQPMVGWGGVGQEELTWLLGQLPTAQPLPHSTACAALGLLQASWGGNKEVSCPCKEQCQRLSLWQGLRGLLWLCREGSHRPLSISLCLAPSWGRDYKSP